VLTKSSGDKSVSRSELPETIALAFEGAGELVLDGVALGVVEAPLEREVVGVIEILLVEERVMETLRVADGRTTAEIVAV